MTDIPARQAEIDLMLEALRTTTGDPELDELARYSLLASITGDDELTNAAVIEVGPSQAELDIHLEGASVIDHTVRAEPFGQFVSRTAEAVKEMSKTKLGRKRYPTDLLISATTPGSLRVVLKSPPRRDHTYAALAVVEPSNVESDALRTIAILLAQAGSEDAGSDSGPLSATIEQLPPAARERVRSAVHAIAHAGWNVEGELRQRGVGVVRIHLLSDRVAYLGDELAQTESTVEKGIEILGTIDGTRRFTGSMWFQPVDAEKPFVASVTDAALLERVNELNATPDATVRATFERYTVFRTGSDRSRARTTYALTAIEQITAASIEPIV